jgi:uncharacterized protein (TIGR03790 family)
MCLLFSKGAGHAAPQLTKGLIFLMSTITCTVSLVIFGSLLPCVTVMAQSQRLPGEVLVVYNASSPTSTAIAQYYCGKRHVTNELAIRCADSALTTDAETIGFSDYQSEIAEPLNKYLAGHKGIDFIVLTKGVPIRIRGAATGEVENGEALPSLDSYIAAIDYPEIRGAVKASLAGSGTTGRGWINRYYGATVPFSHEKFGGYLVTRLDGYTQADATGLVDEALKAEQSHVDGKILLDIQSDFGQGDKTTQPTESASPIVTLEASWDHWNGDLNHASDILEASGIPHITADGQAFPGHQSDLLGYFSYGSNDNHFSSSAYESLNFAPGSMCDTAVSTSARTFLPTSGGQTLMTDLISHGLTCCQGYVGEPILDGISSPTIDLSRYLSGFTMAESFYAGTKYIGWEGTCIGDPLCRPYDGKKLTFPISAAAFNSWSGGIEREQCSESGSDLGSISNSTYTSYNHLDLTGVTEIAVRAASGGAGGHVEFRLDSPTGEVIGSCPVTPTGDWQKWETQTCRIEGTPGGYHNLYLVYTGGDGYLFNLEWFALRHG